MGRTIAGPSGGRDLELAGGYWRQPRSPLLGSCRQGRVRSCSSIRKEWTPAGCTAGGDFEVSRPLQAPEVSDKAGGRADRPFSPDNPKEPRDKFKAKQALFRRRWPSDG